MFVERVSWRASRKPGQAAHIRDTHTTTELSVDREIANALFAAGVATFQAPANHERGESECDAVRLRTSQRLSVCAWAFRMGATFTLR